MVKQKHFDRFYFPQDYPRTLLCCCALRIAFAEPERLPSGFRRVEYLVYSVSPHTNFTSRKAVTLGAA